jgi:hypothetical protein
LSLHILGDRLTMPDLGKHAASRNSSVALSQLWRSGHRIDSGDTLLRCQQIRFGSETKKLSCASPGRS